MTRILYCWCCAGPLSHLRDQVTEFPNFCVVLSGDTNNGGGGGGVVGAGSAAAGGVGAISAPQLYRNPFDVPRVALLDQLARMRANFLQVRHTLLGAVRPAVARQYNALMLSSV